jgi:hypothetical protein
LVLDAPIRILLSDQIDESNRDLHRRPLTSVSGTEEMIDWTWQMVGLLGQG